MWKAPLATLAKGEGDCTDYALAKYFALGGIGVPEHDRRLLVVWIKSVHATHTVVAVREEGRWLILDNRRMALVDAEDAVRYIPLLIYDDRGEPLKTSKSQAGDKGLRPNY